MATRFIVREATELNGGGPRTTAVHKFNSREKAMDFANGREAYTRYNSASGLPAFCKRVTVFEVGEDGLHSNIHEVAEH